MRFSFTLGAVVALGGTAGAQVGGQQPRLAHADSSARADALVAAPTARATPDSLRLSRRQAIAEALMHNPQITIAREQTDEARARRVQAIAIPDPALTASYDDQPRFLDFPGAGSRNVAVGMVVPFPDKFRLNNRIGLADVAASQSNVKLQQQTIASQTSQAYDALLVALRHRADLQDGRRLAADFLARTQARYNAGTAAKLDVIKAQVDLAQADNDLIANERDIANAQAGLDRLLGRTIGAPIAPTDSLEVPPPLPDSTSIERIAIANRPELAAVASQQAGARATTALTKEFWLPDLTLGVSRDYVQPGSPLFTTGLALPLPVFLWQHTRGDIAQAQHVERELAATYADTRAQVTQDVRAAYANASTAIRQAIFLRDELVPSAREAFRIASTSYTLGGSSALEVLDARRSLLDAQSQLSDALAAANSATADLERALGVPLTSLGARNP